MTTFAHLLLSSLLAMSGSVGNAATLSGEQLAARVQQALQSRLSDAGSTASLQVVGRLPDQALPPGDVRVDVGAIAGRWPRPQASVPVRISVDGRTVRQLSVRVQVSDPRMVLGYSRALPAGTVQVEATTMLVDMVCCDGVAVPSVRALDGRRLRHAVNAGAPVLLDDLEPLPAVMSRQPVSVAVVRGPIRIVTAGVALQDGQPGERIAVRTAQSPHTINARVVAAGEVTVDE